MNLPGSVWVLLFCTGIAEACYFASLAGAYRRGALSLVYPLARALPVVLVALISLALGREDQISVMGIVGMVLVAAGCLVLPLENLHQISRDNYINPCTLFALGAALGTTAYTLIDDQALRIMRNTTGLGLSGAQIPLLYSQMQSVMIALSLGIFVYLNKTERQILPEIIRKNLGTSIAAGLMSALAYFFVLTAMANVRDVSYVSAFRQISIPLGALLGMVVQKEPAYPVRITGIAVVFTGLILVALG